MRKRFNYNEGLGPEYGRMARFRGNFKLRLYIWSKGMGVQVVDGYLDEIGTRYVNNVCNLVYKADRKRNICGCISDHLV